MMIGVIAAGPATLEQAVERCSARTTQSYAWTADMAETAWRRTTGEAFR